MRKIMMRVAWGCRRVSWRCRMEVEQTRRGRQFESLTSLSMYLESNFLCSFMTPTRIRSNHLTNFSRQTESTLQSLANVIVDLAVLLRSDSTCWKDGLVRIDKEYSKDVAIARQIWIHKIHNTELVLDMIRKDKHTILLKGNIANICIIRRIPISNIPPQIFRVWQVNVAGFRICLDISCLFFLADRRWIWSCTTSSCQ